MDKGITNMNLINMDAFPVEVSPKIKQGAAAEEIAFSIGESALGVVLVARSADGVCAILIGSEAAELESDLARRFIDSKLVRNDRKLSNDLQKILRFIEAPSEGLNLSLDIRGTPFQLRVWEESLRIPPGSIVTYGRSPTVSANPALFGPLQMPALPTRSPWLSRATGSSEAMARSPATAGVLSASARSLQRRR
jgi:hypothetical protein